jgi:stage V sporulation protein B
MSDASESARDVGRGFLVITGAKLWFLVTGTVLNLALPRLLGNAARFGEFRVVNGLLTIVNMVLISGTIQAVSKRVSERESSARAVRRAAHRLQALVGGTLALLFLAGAGPIAAVALQDEALAPYLRLGAVVIACYAFYAVQVGVLNGLKRFAWQAALDVTFSTSKAVSMVGLVLAGFAVTGALAGFALAALLVLGLSLLVVRRVVPRAPVGDVEGSDDVRLAGFLGQVMLTTLAVNALLQLDTVLLKALSAGPFLAVLTGADAQARADLMAATTAALGGAAPTAPDAAGLAREAASALAGLYGAAKNVAVIPYQLILSITFVVFPLVSRATVDHDRERTETYVRQTLRFTTLLTTWFALMLFLARRPLLALLFGSGYGLAGPALGLLLAGVVPFSLHVVAGTVITGAGRPGVSLALGAVSALLATAAVGGAVAWAPGFEGALTDAAGALLAATVVAAVLPLAWLRAAFGPVVPWATLGRVGVAAAVLVIAAAWVPLEGLAGLAMAAGLGGLGFPLALVALREVRGADLRRLAGLLPGRRSA